MPVEIAKMVGSDANAVVEESYRIHAGSGFSNEYEIERIYRATALMLIGEGTSGIQKMIIGRNPLKDWGAIKKSRHSGHCTFTARIGKRASGHQRARMRTIRVLTPRPFQ